MPVRSHFILALTAAAAACGGDPSATTDVPVQIEDSARVRIVAYPGTPSVEPVFRFAAEPRYRHGANPGDYAFQGVGIGRLLPDGRAVVEDPWNSEVVVIGRDGAAYEVLASQGEGPGDVIGVNAIFSLGQDSILVTDSNLGRATLFVGGSVAGTTDIRSAIRLRVKGIGPAGGLLMATSLSDLELVGDWRRGHMARFDMVTGALDTVASYDSDPRTPAGMEWDPIRAVGEVTVAGGRFVYTRSDRAEVTWHRADGGVVQIMRWRAQPTLLAEESLGAIEDANRVLFRMQNPNTDPVRIEEAIRLHMANFRASVGRPMPFFRSPFTDDEGRIWLPAYRPGVDETGVAPYTVIGAGGEWLGVVEAPPTFRILDVAGGLVLGVEADEMDVESVAVYELVRG